MGKTLIGHLIATFLALALRDILMLKMYILVKEDAPLGIAAVSIAHASLATYLKFSDDPAVKEWVSGSFRKVVCKVTGKEFEKAKEVADHVVLTESSYDGQEVSIAFKPRVEYPKFFRYLRPYR